MKKIILIGLCLTISQITLAISSKKITPKTTPQIQSIVCSDSLYVGRTYFKLDLLKGYQIKQEAWDGLLPNNKIETLASSNEWNMDIHSDIIFVELIEQSQSVGYLKVNLKEKFINLSFKSELIYKDRSLGFLLSCSIQMTHPTEDSQYFAE